MSVMQSQSWLPSWTSHPSPHPPGCDCGCRDDCGPPWNAEAIRCWSEMQQFKQMLKEVIADMGPLALRGSVDGCPAKPGVVGEFIRQDVVVPLASPTLDYTISPLILPPGDWNVWAWGEFDIQCRGALFHLNPAQPGFTGGMTGRAMLVAPALFDSGHYIDSEPAFAVISAPTLVAFSMTLFDPVWGSGGSKVQFACAARRMR